MKYEAINSIFGNNSTPNLICSIQNLMTYAYLRFEFNFQKEIIIIHVIKLCLFLLKFYWYESKAHNGSLFLLLWVIFSNLMTKQLVLLSCHSTDHICLFVCVQVSGVCTACGVRCRWRATCWRWRVTAAACAPGPPWSCSTSTRPSSTCGTAARRSCTLAVWETRPHARSKNSEFS